jgi:hypothetical protein
MRRRTVLSGTVALALAGCLGSDDDPGPSSPTGDGTSATDTDGSSGGDSTPSLQGDFAPPDSVRALTFGRLDDCPDETASLSDRTVSFGGCIRGANGCTYALLDGLTYDESAGELTVVVGTVEDRGPDESCTQAIVERGYEGRVTLATPPKTVVLVHDGVDGRQEVLRRDVSS